VNGGSVSPGNSPGVVTVGEDLEFVDSEYRTELYRDGEADHIMAKTISFDADSSVVISSRDGFLLDTPYRIMQAEETITLDAGTDIGFDRQYLFLNDPAGTITADCVDGDGECYDVTITRNGVTFDDDSIVRTDNQHNVAEAIAGLDDSDAIVASMLLSEDEADARARLDNLSGDTHSTQLGTFITQTQIMNDAVGSRVNGAFAAGGVSGGGGADLGVLSSAGARYGGWARTYGEWAELDDDGTASAVDSRIAGVMLGFDVASESSLVGLAAGFASSSADAEDFDSTSDADTLHVLAYGAHRFGALRLSGGAGYGWASIDTERRPAGDRLTASYDAEIANLFGEVAYETGLGGFAVEPFAGLAYTHVDADGFTETGGAGALTSDGADFDGLSSTLGVRFAHAFTTGDGVVVRPNGMLGWRHAYGDLTPDRVMTFSGTGADFIAEGLPIARDSLVLTAGVEFGLNENLTVGLDYRGSFASEATSNAVNLTGRLEF